MHTKTTLLIILLFTSITTLAQPGQRDWLVQGTTKKSIIRVENDGKDIVLDNGLVRRTFRIRPNVACTEYVNLVTGQQLLRAVEPEAKLTINGKELNVGGLYGQKEKAYLLSEWIDKFTASDKDFKLVKYRIDNIKPYLNSSTKFWSTNKVQSKGKEISFEYSLDGELKGLVVTVHYNLYDGLPLISKWLSIENHFGKPIKLDRVVNEVLGLVEEQSAVVGKTNAMEVQKGLYFESNYAFNNSMRYDLSDQTTHWKRDADYTSQVNYDYNTPVKVEIYPESGPGITLSTGEMFTSIRTWELTMDSYDRQRRGMAIQKMYSTIAPWTTANPIFMHLVSKDDEQVRTAIDQCAATGYEALILSFGSHINMEDTSRINLQRWKTLADHAHNKGIAIGGYSLFSSRKISVDDDVIDIKTGKPGGAFFGNAPCFGSRWGLGYRDKIKTFFQSTGFDIWENDGPYPGDLCGSKNHPGHKNYEDSQWRQMEIQKELYHWLNAKGVYINAPDWYFLDGTNKIALGYREVNFSLPRENQMILNRQNIFDGTWEKSPSMGWGFVPLTAYQGGGPEAVLEPLSTHLKDYRQLMMQYYGSGIQACYRGPRLYDTEKTRATVKEVIDWYKRYRDILNSPVIHLRRADGREWDGVMHVNPDLNVKALLMLYNPLKQDIKRTIKIPLFYTGLTKTARLSEQNGSVKTYTIDRNDEVTYTINLKADSYTWIKVQ
ncbi:MAG: alpha-galactosidase [Sphingobacteriaceae bacterium]|nr:alpha-galactosidase [Sphingobacteriaceae bacterium]